MKEIYKDSSRYDDYDIDTVINSTLQQNNALFYDIMDAASSNRNRIEAAAGTLHLYTL